MSYRTIGQKVQKTFKDRTGMLCNCGTKITKKNIRYYLNEYGERKPICKYCAEIIKEYLEVI